jgi:hypothetical protein
MPLIDVPFKRVAMDLVGPIQPVTTSGYQYILTVVDYATRYPEATPLKRITTEAVAEALVAIYSRVGIPEEVLTDQGRQFVGEVMREVSRLLSIRQLTTTPYHPQTNGLCERFNGVLKQMLRRMCDERPQDWDRYIAPLLFAYREVPQASLGFSPFELLYGRTVRGPMTILRELWTAEIINPEVKSTYEYVFDLRNRLEDTCKMAQIELTKSSDRYRTHFDKRAKPRSFNVNDMVLLLLPSANDKLRMRWQGPYRVKERVGFVDYRVDKDGTDKLYHANLLKKYEVREPHNVVPLNPALGTLMCTAMGMIMPSPVDHGVEGEKHAYSDMVEFVPLQGKQTIEDVHIAPELTDPQVNDVRQLLRKYTDILTDMPGRSKIGSHDIQLTSNDPVRSRAYSTPFATRDVVIKEVQSMIDMGIIEPSSSPYASPIILIKKTSGVYDNG